MSTYAHVGGHMSAYAYAGVAMSCWEYRYPYWQHHAAYMARPGSCVGVMMSVLTRGMQ